MTIFERINAEVIQLGGKPGRILVEPECVYFNSSDKLNCGGSVRYVEVIRDDDGPNLWVTCGDRVAKTFQSFEAQESEASTIAQIAEEFIR